jgi:hypothetical protein
LGGAALGAVALVALGVFALRGGTFVPISPALATLAGALAIRVAMDAARRRRGASGTRPA